MKSRGAFEQCYNAQAAVDAESQVIVAQSVTNAANDTAQLTGLVESIEQSLDRKPEETSADAGYFTEENLEFLEEKSFKVGRKRCTSVDRFIPVRFTLSLSPSHLHPAPPFAT